MCGRRPFFYTAVFQKARFFSAFFQASVFSFFFSFLFFPPFFFSYQRLRPGGVCTLISFTLYLAKFYIFLFPEIKCLKPNCLGGRDGKVSVFPCYFHIFPDQITRKKLEQVNIVI